MPFLFRATPQHGNRQTAPSFGSQPKGSRAFSRPAAGTLDATNSPQRVHPILHQGILAPASCPGHVTNFFGVASSVVVCRRMSRDPAVAHSITSRRVVVMRSRVSQSRSPPARDNGSAWMLIASAERCSDLDEVSSCGEIRAMADNNADGPGSDAGVAGPARRAAPNGIVLEYRLEEPVSLVDAPAFAHIERWTVSVLVDDPNAEDDRRDIGYARLIVLNLDAGITLADLADTASGDWVEVIRPVVMPGDLAVADARDDDPEFAETSVLVLDRLWIEPDSRGNGLGPIIAAYAVLRLGRGCRLAACYPAPFEDVALDADRDRSIEALGSVWAKVGFTPWNNGVWMLDLHTTDLRDALERLVPLPHGTSLGTSDDQG
jgi:GNAT superfamily N-acetyltransferase